MTIRSGQLELKQRLSLASGIIMPITWQGLNQRLCKRKRKKEKRGRELFGQSEVTVAQHSIPYRANLAQTLAWPQADCAVERDPDLICIFLRGLGWGWLSALCFLFQQSRVSGSPPFPKVFSRRQSALCPPLPRCLASASG